MAFCREAIPSSTNCPYLSTNSGTDSSRQRIAFFDLLINMIFVVLRAHLRVAAKCKRPIDYADPVIRLRIVGLQLDMFLMIGFGFLKLLRIKRLAAHLKQNGADPVDGAQIVGIFFQHAFEFIDGCVATLDVLVGGRAGYVLAGISRGQIQTRIKQLRDRGP